MFRVAAANGKIEPKLMAVNGNLSTGVRPDDFGSMAEIGMKLRCDVGKNKNGIVNPADAKMVNVNANDFPIGKSSELQIVNNRDKEHLKDG